MNCDTRHIHNANCLEWLDDYGHLRTCCNIIFFFMGDVRRARLWTGALKLALLAPRLHKLRTAVVLVAEVPCGNDGDLRAAARLAQELELPFPLIADSQHTLWRRYGAPAFEPVSERAGLVLVDGSGLPEGAWPLQEPQQRLELPAVFSTLEVLAAK